MTLDYRGGQAAESPGQEWPSVCAGVSEIHSFVGAGEILYQIFKEVVSTRLNKCKVNSIKVVLVSVRLSFGAKGQREND